MRSTIDHLTVNGTVIVCVVVPDVAVTVKLYDPAAGPVIVGLGVGVLDEWEDPQAIIAPTKQSTPIISMIFFRPPEPHSVIPITGRHNAKAVIRHIGRLFAT